GQNCFHSETRNWPTRSRRNYWRNFVSRKHASFRDRDRNRELSFARDTHCLIGGEIEFRSIIWSTVLPGARHSQFQARERTSQFIDRVVPCQTGRLKFERSDVG